MLVSLSVLLFLAAGPGSHAGVLAHSVTLERCFHLAVWSRMLAVSSTHSPTKSVRGTKDRVSLLITTADREETGKRFFAQKAEKMITYC